MRIGLLGYGVVGAGVDHIAEKTDGVSVKKVLCLNVDDVSGGRGVTDVAQIINDDGIDTVAEAMGGLHPAFEFACAALKAGKNYVTANKALVAAYLPELLALAEENGAALRCTAAVGGGIPWLVNLERCRRVDTIHAIRGIFNGTTNFILDAMHTGGADFEAVLAQAQRLGYAEANPAADIDGDDVRRKLVISIAAAFGKRVREKDVPTFGIRSITAQDVRNFKALGKTCKLIARAACRNALSASVEPMLLPSDTPESAVPRNFNLVTYESENAGVQSFYGQGAGRYPTAYNMIQDCLDISDGVRAFYTKRQEDASIDNAGVVCCYYIRTAAMSDWLENAAASKANGYVITKAVSQAEAHRALEHLRTIDPQLFFAAIA